MSGRRNQPVAKGQPVVPIFFRVATLLQASQRVLHTRSRNEAETKRIGRDSRHNNIVALMKIPAILIMTNKYYYGCCVLLSNINVYIYIYIHIIHESKPTETTVRPEMSTGTKRTASSGTEASQLLGVQGCGVSGCGVSRHHVQSPSRIPGLGMKSPHLQLLRLHKLLFSNPTSSNTTSLNSQNSDEPGEPQPRLAVPAPFFSSDASGRPPGLSTRSPCGDHARRPHPQKSDSISWLDLNCSE